MRGIILTAVLTLARTDVSFSAQEIVVASYNLENYLGEDQAVAPSRRAHPKTEEAISAEIAIIRGIAPDILGVCEMGRPELFGDFKNRLAKAGLNYIDSEYVEAADPDRHLALLSRYPIIHRQSQTNLIYDLAGVPHKVLRGFLDVTVRVDDHCELRLLGVHLKSKLPVPEGDALIRRHEATLLRQYLEKILAANPSVNLLVYGDFNDTRNESPIQEIAGPLGTSMRMTELSAKDSAGERWTQYWEAADLYSRIDYFFASPALLHRIVPFRTGIDRSPSWFKASDHRAIFTSIVTDAPRAAESGK